MTIRDVFIRVCMKEFLKHFCLVCFHVFWEAGEDIQEWKAFHPSGLFFFLTSVHAHTVIVNDCRVFPLGCLPIHTHTQTSRHTVLGQ